MTAKEYLMKLKYLDTEINRKLEKISALRASLTSIPAVNTSEERVQGSSTSNDARFVRTLAEINELEIEVNENIDNFVDEKRKIINQIYQLDNDLHIKILYKKYVEFKDFILIAEELKYCHQYILNVHGQALKDFENVIGML